MLAQQQAHLDPTTTTTLPTTRLSKADTETQFQTMATVTTILITYRHGPQGSCFSLRARHASRARRVWVTRPRSVASSIVLITKQLQPYDPCKHVTIASQACVLCAQVSLDAGRQLQDAHHVAFRCVLSYMVQSL